MDDDASTTYEVVNIVLDTDTNNALTRRSLRVCNSTPAWLGQSGDGWTPRQTPPTARLHQPTHTWPTPSNGFSKTTNSATTPPSPSIDPSPRDRPTSFGADSTNAVVVCSPAASLASSMPGQWQPDRPTAIQPTRPVCRRRQAAVAPPCQPTQRSRAQLPKVTSALPRHKTDTRQPTPNPTPARSCRRPCCRCRPCRAASDPTACSQAADLSLFPARWG